MPQRRRAWFNDNNADCVAWLKVLIKRGILPEGDVDDRDLALVRPEDLRGYTECHFFAGIGGWAHALQLARWPGEEVWTGSCPCQPFSVAGHRKGFKDVRHLWPVWFRLIDVCRPAVLFGEQVSGPAGRGWLAVVRADLERAGYAVGAADLPAASVGAPHIRQRLYFVGDADDQRSQGRRLGGDRADQRAAGEASVAAGLADHDQDRRDRLAAARLHERRMERQANRKAELTGHAGTTLTDAANLAAWPSPCTPNGGRSMSIEKMDATGLTLDGRKHTASLEHAVKFAATNWPSPKAQEDGRTLEQYEAGRQRGYENRKGKTPGGPSGKQGGLAIASQLASWPTATVHDAERGGQGKRAMNETRHGSNLQDFAMLATWPTARATDGEKNVRSVEGSAREMERKGGPQDLNQASTLATLSGEPSSGSPASTAKCAS